MTLLTSEPKTLHEFAIQTLASYIKNDPNALRDYKVVIRHLNKTKQYYVKCYLIDNKYLYGSFITEAKNLANKLSLSEFTP